ncbi:dienelactone hydrolase family protein [soil metagenome]
MRGEMIRFEANGGTAPGYLVTPEPGRGGPGLVLLQEWWGLVDHIKDVADRFAGAGFVVLAPDLYDGQQTKSPDQAAKMFMALRIGEAAKDIRGAARHLIARADVTPKNVGVVGFCMGGQLALYAAQEYPEEFGAAVDFYGVHPNVPIDPAKVRVPVQLHFGKRDTNVPEAKARELVERLSEGSSPVDAHFYDADHAFFNDTRPEVYDSAAADDAWTRTVAFFIKHLS